MSIVTLEDVANRAGVTTMTISRFFRDPARVSNKTRTAIEHAIDDLGYVRDGFAARLAGRHSPILAIIVPSMDHPYAAEVVRGVSEVAIRSGAALMVYETMFDADRQDHMIVQALSWRPDGIIHLGGSLSASARRKVEATGCRFVEAWDLVDDPLHLTVGVSNSVLTYEIASALATAYAGPVAFALRRSGHPVEDQRLAGYRKALRDFGLQAIEVEVAATLTSLAAGSLLLETALRRVERPRAILFAGDLLALGAILAATQKNVKIPDDVAIAGIGGYEIGQHMTPSLSTVSIPSKETGVHAAELALGARKSESNKIILQYQLVTGTSAKLD